MKKLIKLCTALILVASLSGCADWMGTGDNKTTTTTSRSTTAATTTTTQTTANTTTAITTTGTSK